MFQIGFWELVVVAVVALWVFGPERLPAIARVCGRYIIRAKNSVLAIKNEISEEFDNNNTKNKNMNND
jgi:sec-independent protein translocase protein TatB